MRHAFEERKSPSNTGWENKVGASQYCGEGVRKPFDGLVTIAFRNVSAYRIGYVFEKLEAHLLDIKISKCVMIDFFGLSNADGEIGLEL